MAGLLLMGLNADERSRTSTSRSSQAPEACASANSATSARVGICNPFARWVAADTSINGSGRLVKNFILMLDDVALVATDKQVQG